MKRTLNSNFFIISISKYQLVMKCVTLVGFFCEFQGNLEA